MLIFVDVLVFLFGLLGAILLGLKYKEGFIAFGLHNTGTMILAGAAHNFGLLSICCIFLILDVVFYIRWLNDERQAVQK